MKRINGFTLIEMMVVVAIIGVLATMALFGLSSGEKAARDAQRVQIVKGVQTALARYYGDAGKYPAVASDVGSATYPNCVAFTNWSIGGFGGLLSFLIGTGYLTGPVPEPSTGNDLNCGYSCTALGTGTCIIGDLGKGAKLGDNACGWDHCSIYGTTPWPMGYHYYSDGKTYTIILNKESGGDVTFTSPK